MSTGATDEDIHLHYHRACDTIAVWPYSRAAVEWSVDRLASAGGNRPLPSPPLPSLLPLASLPARARGEVGGESGGKGAAAAAAAPAAAPTPSRNAAASPLPAMADQYIIGERIGVGSFGQVFKGVEVATGRAVALKTVDLENADDEIEVRGRLDEEGWRGGGRVLGGGIRGKE